MLKKLVSFSLLFFFLVYITPSEVLHVLTSHSDTRHEPHEGKGLRIDPEHHHCKLLQDFHKLDVAGMSWPMPVHASQVDYFLAANLLPAQDFFKSPACSTIADRAPPALCSGS